MAQPLPKHHKHLAFFYELLPQNGILRPQRRIFREQIGREAEDKLPLGILSFPFAGWRFSHDVKDRHFFLSEIQAQRCACV
ncbi:MAG TPA: hypothetical protein VL357_03105 [Rariglobus sp.]|nr:hypothetical protein [Rariglobus sp.]